MGRGNLGKKGLGQGRGNRSGDVAMQLHNVACGLH